MESPARPSILHPDVSRISDSLRVLSDELPKLSNLESTAILHALQGLREDLRHYAVVQDDLGILLDSKLTRIQEMLRPLERRVWKLEQPTVSILHPPEEGGSDSRTSVKDEGRGPSGSSQSVITDISPSSVSGSPPSPVSLGHVPPSKSVSHEPLGAFRLGGVYGALSVMFVTLIPLILALVYFEPE
ncbi:hypothetical protein JB92DRAFT_3113400 [Gautieria morchelliformis]|nr:hypothetical protein JB92DRAFT_3113400 [Gautieria morchelliformis]